MDIENSQYSVLNVTYKDYYLLSNFNSLKFVIKMLVIFVLLILAIKPTLGIPVASSVIVKTKISPSGLFYQSETACYPYAIYEKMVYTAKEMGYSSLRDYIMAKIPPNIRGRIKYSEIVEKDFVVITITAQYLSPKEVSELSNNLIKIKKENGYIIFEDNTYTNQSNSEDAWLHYYLQMPGEIVESNAQIVNGNTAEWHLKGRNIGRIYAVAKLPIFPKMPGFTVSSSFLALLVVIFFFRRKLNNF